MYPSIVSVGQIEGGTVPNAVAENARLCGTVRTTEENVRKQIIAGIKRIVNAAGRLHNADVKVEIIKGYPAVTNTCNESEIARTAVKNIIGDEALVDTQFASMGGEDFSYYLDKYRDALQGWEHRRKALRTFPLIALLSILTRMH
jgi:hippurate hydrolase